MRSSIFQEPYVQEISSLSMTADGRALGVEFSGVLYNGETIRVEVNTGDEYGWGLTSAGFRRPTYNELLDALER